MPDLSSSPDRYYLGVDGGQSSTTALIANQHGWIVGQGIGGPCNHVAAAEGRRKFLFAIGDCMHQAYTQAGLTNVKFAAACFGLSGGSEDKAAYIHELIHSAKWKLTHDGEIALTGATAGAPGIIVIAGTGSIAYGRNRLGVSARTGGWGYVYGDEGGAFDLTRRALRAALKMEEGWGPATSLRALLLRKTQAASANELMHRFYGDFPRALIATYAPLVSQAAEEGDAVAQAILTAAAAGLCSYVQGVHQQLFAPSEVPRISYIGGVFTSELMRTNFTAIARQTLSANVGPPRYSPAVGAVIEALRLDGIDAMPTARLPDIIGVSIS